MFLYKLKYPNLWQTSCLKNIVLLSDPLFSISVKTCLSITNGGKITEKLFKISFVLSWQLFKCVAFQWRRICERSFQKCKCKIYVKSFVWSTKNIQMFVKRKRLNKIRTQQFNDLETKNLEIEEYTNEIERLMYQEVMRIWNTKSRQWLFIWFWIESYERRTQKGTSGMIWKVIQTKN